MRPDLDDILSGVQRLLMNDFVPALMSATPFLAEQALYANLVLEYCKKAWPRMHLALAEEHGDLCATLGTAAGALRGAGATPGAAAVVAAIDAELAGGASDVTCSTLDTLAQRNRTLRELVSRVVVLLDAASDAARPGEPPHAARTATDAYLVRAAARQYRELTSLGLNW
jgi:hypothetical protein